MHGLAAMLADAAEAHAGKLFIQGGGWDHLFVRALPAVHPMMSLAVLLSADESEAPGTGQLRVQLVDEDGKDAGLGAVATVALGHGPFHRPGQRTPAVIALPFPGVRFERPGTYEFRLYWNDGPIGSPLQFHVTLVPPTFESPASPTSA